MEALLRFGAIKKIKIVKIIKRDRLIKGSSLNIFFLDRLSLE